MMDWDGVGWWWLVTFGGMLLIWGVVAWVVVQRVRGSRGTSTRSSRDPEAILAARLARGEIDAAEYRQRLDRLHGRDRAA